jgi:hypothetical protein
VNTVSDKKKRISWPADLGNKDGVLGGTPMRVILFIQTRDETQKDRYRKRCSDTETQKKRERGKEGGKDSEKEWMKVENNMTNAVHVLRTR